MELRLTMIKPVAERAIKLLNTLHTKSPQAFSEQFLAPGDQERWPFMDVLPGAVIVNDSAKLIAMHDHWFASNETAFKPYYHGAGLNRAFITDDLLYCAHLAGAKEAVRCGVNAYVVKEQNLGDSSTTIITMPMHLSMIFAFDRETNEWWVTHITNTPLP
jgi:hypothetical protein